jgi:hypothetical protein
MNPTKLPLSTTERAGDHVSSDPDRMALPRDAFLTYRAGVIAYMLWGMVPQHYSCIGATRRAVVSTQVRLTWQQRFE